MPFYMQHPEHGVHICYTPEDVKAHEAIGWKLKDVNGAYMADTKEAAEPCKKRGRKPKAK